jgi:hypothetical protein
MSMNGDDISPAEFGPCLTQIGLKSDDWRLQIADEIRWRQVLMIERRDSRMPAATNNVKSLNGYLNGATPRSNTFGGIVSRSVRRRTTAEFVEVFGCASRTFRGIKRNGYSSKPQNIVASAGRLFLRRRCTESPSSVVTSSLFAMTFLTTQITHDPLYCHVGNIKGPSPFRNWRAIRGGLNLSSPSKLTIEYHLSRCYNVRSHELSRKSRNWRTYVRATTKCKRVLKQTHRWIMCLLLEIRLRSSDWSQPESFDHVINRLSLSFLIILYHFSSTVSWSIKLKDFPSKNLQFLWIPNSNCES